MKSDGPNRRHHKNLARVGGSSVRLKAAEAKLQSRRANVFSTVDALSPKRGGDPKVSRLPPVFPSLSLSTAPAHAALPVGPVAAAAQRQLLTDHFRELVGREVQVQSPGFSGPGLVVWANPTVHQIEVVPSHGFATFNLQLPVDGLELLPRKDLAELPMLAPRTDSELEGALSTFQQPLAIYRSTATPGLTARGLLGMARDEPRVYQVRWGDLLHEFDLPSLHERGELLVVYDGKATREDVLQLGRRTPGAATPVVLTKHPVSSVAQKEGPLNALVTSLAAQGSVFSGPVLYDHFASRPDQVTTLVRRWYEGHAEGVLNAGAFLAPAHRALLLDPGIVQHLEVFRPFYEGAMAVDPTVTAAQVRAAFSAKLGDVEVWRGVTLPEEDIEHFRLHGAAPGVLRTGQASLLRSLFDPELQGRHGRNGKGVTGILDALTSHLSGDTWGSPVVSVTGSIDVAHMAAWDDFFRRPTPGRFCLARLRLPTLDVLTSEGVLAGPSRAVFPEGTTFHTTRADGQPFSKPFHEPDFEMFATQRGSVVELFPYDQNPGPWWRS